ncbi:helix-turn-helix domain-containing protein [Saccharopolyspora sp. 5N708]|uniref:helix-turn-helix domain-containing protein n=1 Tax=Saccharopolyspora sp. 5N708 TaxID=3457424 RepID=UPI003FD1634D
MPYLVHLRPEKLREYCNARGWDVDDFAEAAQRSRSTVYRALSGDQPGPELIAACVVLFGEAALPELFRFSHSHEEFRPTRQPCRPLASHLGRRNTR